MKAKKIVPEKKEQPNPLPMPSNQESEDELAPWQKEIIALAKARLSVSDEQDVIDNMYRRALGLCRIVEDLTLSESESEVSGDALGSVMEVVREDIEVARWLTRGRPLDSRLF
jgi:hypothetical protein